MRWSLMLPAWATLALVSARTVAAQQPPHTHDHPATAAPRMQMIAPMMRSMAFAPEHLLQRKDSLFLTPQQITRLTTLRDALKKVHDAAMADAKPHQEAMSQAFNAAPPDTAAVRSHFLAAHDAMGRAHAAMLAAAVRARALLTDEQRARVEQETSAMKMMCDGEHSSH